MCAKFQQNQRTLFFTWKSFVKFSLLSNLKLNFIPIRKLFHQNSKIPHIHLSWTLSVPSFRKIREPFLIRRSGGREVGREVGRSITTAVAVVVRGGASQLGAQHAVHSLNRIFFWFCKKSGECSKINEIYLLWTSSDKILSKIREPFLIRREGGRSVGRSVHYHGCRRGCQGRGVAVRGTARRPFFKSDFFHFT